MANSELYESGFVVDALSIQDEVGIFYGETDPSEVGFPAPRGSLYLRKPISGDGGVYKKYGDGDTQWLAFDASASSNQAIVTTGINHGQTVVCDSFSKTNGYACVWDYTIKNGANIRTGTVRGCWNTDNEVSYDEVSNNDLGQTGKLKFAVVIVGPLVEVTATVSATGTDGWEVRLLRRNFTSSATATVNAGETAVIDTFTKTSCYAMVVYYSVSRLTNLRVGTMNVCWNTNDEVSWDDTSVNDLGQTKMIDMSVGINGAYVEIRATVGSTGGDGWTVQTIKNTIN